MRSRWIATVGIALTSYSLANAVTFRLISDESDCRGGSMYCNPVTPPGGSLTCGGSTCSNCDGVGDVLRTATIGTQSIEFCSCNADLGSTTALAVGCRPVHRITSKSWGCQADSCPGVPGHTDHCIGIDSGTPNCYKCNCQ